MIVTIPASNQDEDVTLLSAKLATSFFLESFIHSKEKLNIVQWVELLTKKFDSSAAACRWFLDAMADDSHWLVTIFLKCQVATIRQMFHRICIHVIQKLRATEKDRSGFFFVQNQKTQFRIFKNSDAQNLEKLSFCPKI